MAGRCGEERVRGSARIACALGFVDHLSAGIDTMVGDPGVGQRASEGIQLIAQPPLGQTRVPEGERV